MIRRPCIIKACWVLVLIGVWGGVTAFLSPSNVPGSKSSSGLSIPKASIQLYQRPSNCSIRRLNSSCQAQKIHSYTPNNKQEGHDGFKRKLRLIIDRSNSWRRLKRMSPLASAAYIVGACFCSNQALPHYLESPPRRFLTSCKDGFDKLTKKIGNVARKKSVAPFIVAAAMFLVVNVCTQYFGTTSPAAASLVQTHPSLLARGGEIAVRASKKGKNTLEVQKAVFTASKETTRTLTEAIGDLKSFMVGPKSDSLLLLLATALITPICKLLGTSPILGFLASGMALGPNGLKWISGIHTTETLAELGIVFFLFEMGIELSVERLMSMKKDVFGLGLSQFLLTAAAIGGAGCLAGLSGSAAIVLGGGLALSSSAFVLQLLKDKDQLATRFGKASFGVLLFQDLAVVPLLVVTPILAGGGRGLASALGNAVVKASLALGSIALAGRYLLNPLFKIVAQSQSQEAFLGVTLLTVLSMSFLTEGLGLSNTLGAFLAGVLLSETKYRYQIEADIAPFRAILLGLFFVTVGFEIDVGLIASNLPSVLAIVTGILATKTVIASALALLFGLSLSTSSQTGLILSQGGEFAFVAFGLARSVGIFDQKLTKLLLTSVSLTMALTPFLASLGAKIAKKLEERSDFTHYLGDDSDAKEIKQSDDFVIVVGYGAVGKVVCDLLDRKLIKYVGLEIDPNKAIQARNKGLPVFYGDIGRTEVAEAFNVGKAKAVIVCISDKAQTNRAVIALRRLYPDMKIFCRATDADHAGRLQKTLDVAAMVPILPEDNMLLTLPFGGAVLKSLGAPAVEVNAILEAKRKEVLSGRGLQDNEEELALLQLGIATQEDDDDDAEDDQQSPTEAAAAHALEETQDVSPMVADVIEAACPGSVTGVECDDEEDDFVGATNGTVAAGVIGDE